jgi:hypothetical protein
LPSSEGDVRRCRRGDVGEVKEEGKKVERGKRKRGEGGEVEENKGGKVEGEEWRRCRSERG